MINACGTDKWLEGLLEQREWESKKIWCSVYLQRKQGDLMEWMKNYSVSKYQKLVVNFSTLMKRNYELLTS